MNEETIQQIKEIEKEMLEAHKVYENKMAKVWDRFQKLKRDLKSGIIT